VIVFWKSVRQKASATEGLGWNSVNSLFDGVCSKLLDQRKGAKLQWLQNPYETNGDYMNHVRPEIDRTSTNRKREHLKERKNNKHETNGKNKSLIDFKKSYQPKINLLKDENGDLLVDSRFLQYFDRWRYYFSQLLKVHSGKYVRQTEMHTAEPLLSEHSFFSTLKLLLNSWKGINRQVLIKFRQN
jgi:hypothetical protein